MKNDYLAYIIILSVGIIVFGAVFLLNTNTGSGAISDSANILSSVSSGNTDSGDVSIVLTPRSIADGLIEVEIAADTHSVDLDQFNLKEISVLEYNGKVFKPVSASSLSGHHSSGMLSFDVGKEPSDFVIKIKGIPNVEERIFEWRG